MNVYFKDRSKGGKLGVVNVRDVEDYEEAVLMVKEQLVADEVGYDEPVLALIKGGKNEKPATEVA